MRIPIVVQHRHVHLSLDDLQMLFGIESCEPTEPIGHHGQFITEHTLEIHGDDGILKGVRVLGPHRDQTQVEISASEAAALGLRAPVRVSGDLNRTASCILVGPTGKIKSVSSVIVPARHLHLNEQTATQLGLEHGQLVAVQTSVEHPVRIDHVTVRIHPTFANEFHLSADEAADSWAHTGQFITLCE